MIIPDSQALVEKAVIGSLLEDTSLIDGTKDVLHYNMFEHPACALIYKSMLEMEGPIDVVTLVAYLDKRGELKNAMGVEFIASLTDFCIKAYIKEYITSLHDYYYKRRVTHYLLHSKNAFADIENLHTKFNLVKKEMLAWQ